MNSSSSVANLASDQPSTSWWSVGTRRFGCTSDGWREGDEAARDVAQDVWLRALRGIGRLRDGSKLRPWLFGIARRALMDRLRQQYATRGDSDVDVEALPAGAFSDDSRDEMTAMEDELARLPVD